MGKTRTWEEICRLYDRQWVELINYEWLDKDPWPSCGVIRSHSSDKKAFYAQCKREPVPVDSAIVYVGHPPWPKGVVFSPSLVRVDECEK